MLHLMQNKEKSGFYGGYLSQLDISINAANAGYLVDVYRFMSNITF